MRKRAGLARGLVLEPEILMFDEPDSGLDPVRTAFLNELILDLNRKLGTTIIVVTHDIATARRIADYIGMLYLRKLVQFGPAKDMFESDIPAVKQFLAGQTEGPIGMSEEADRSKPVSTSGMTAEETEELERQAGAPPEGEDQEAAFAGGGEGEATTEAREEALESAKKRQEQARKEEPESETEDREEPRAEDDEGEEGFLTGILKRSKQTDEADERFENYAQAGQSQSAESPGEEEVKIVGRRGSRHRRKKGKAASGQAQPASEASETSQAESADDQATVARQSEDEWKGDVL
jgi:ABC-type multidrug transport system ATPase subunit